MNVVPAWFWLALLLNTLIMLPAMMRRWQSLHGGRRGGMHGLFDSLYVVISRLWLPAALVVVPAVYVLRVLLF